MNRKITTGVQGLPTGFTYIRASGDTKPIPRYANKVIVVDGVDDDVELNAEAALGNPIILSEGTYNISNTLTIRNNLIGQGHNTIIQGASALVNPILIDNTASDSGTARTQIGGDNPINSVSAGSLTLTTVADRTGSISAGDVLIIADNTNWHNIRGQYTNGEFVTVQSITPTTITLTNPLWLSYTGTVRRLYRMNFIDNIVVSGFRVNYGGTANDGALIQARGLRKAIFSNLFLDGNVGNKQARIGIELVECKDCNINNISVGGIQNLGDPSAEGYGIYINSCEDVIVSDINTSTNASDITYFKATPCKHIIDCDKGIHYLGSPYSLITRNVLFNNIKAYSHTTNPINASPFSSHGGAYNITFNRCTQIVELADSDDGDFVGCLIRSVKNTITNMVINLVTTNSYISNIIKIGENRSLAQGGTGNNGDGRCGEDLYIDNVSVITSRSTGNYTSTSDGCFISVKNDCYAVTNPKVVIKNVTMNGLQGHGILFEGNVNEDILIENNDITFVNQLSGKEIVYFAPQTGTNSPTNIEFINNTVIGANDTTQPYVESTQVITNLTEANNTVS